MLFVFFLGFWDRVGGGWVGIWISIGRFEVLGIFWDWFMFCMGIRVKVCMVELKEWGCGSIGWRFVKDIM